jgi:fructose/tagatose bisphosphate aldolase
MPLVPLRLILDHAAENDYGVAAFNVNNMEQIQSIMEAADETDSPVIVQASRGARAYSQDNYLRLQESPEKFDPRDYMKPARAAMKAVCVARMTEFGQAGNALKLRETAKV